MKQRDTYKPSEWFDGEKWHKWRYDRIGEFYNYVQTFARVMGPIIRADIGQTQSGLRCYRIWLWGEAMSVVNFSSKISYRRRYVEEIIDRLIGRYTNIHNTKLDAPVEDK